MKELKVKEESALAEENYELGKILKTLGMSSSSVV